MEVFNIVEESEVFAHSFQFVDRDRGKYAAWADAKGQSDISTGPFLFYVYLGLMLTCIFINSRIIFVVLVNTKPTIRPVKKLVVQYSTISICYSVLIFFESIGKNKVRIITTASAEMCQALSYFKHVVYGIFPLNAAVLVYERLIGPSISFGKIVEYKFIATIWLVSAVSNIPEIFHVEYTVTPNATTGHCTQVFIFDSPNVSLAYELLQFVVFHGFMGLYMVVCVYKIRHKLKIILKFERIRRVRMERRVLRLLFVFLSTVVFELLWLPAQVITLVYKIQGYYEKGATDENNTVIAFTFLLQYVVLCGTPLMYMLMNADLPPVFPGFTMYKGNILAERHRDWRRMASRAPKSARESSSDIKSVMLGLERGEMGMYEDGKVEMPVEFREIPLGRDEVPSPRPMISPVCSIDEMEDYALVVRVKENPQTTLVLN